MADVSIILMASQEETLQESVASVLRTIPDYREIVIGAAPGLSDDARAFLEGLPRARLFRGTNDVNEAGQVRLDLLNACRGEWIANCDDDDLWEYFPYSDLEQAWPEVGYVYGDTRLRVMRDAGPWQAGYERILRGGSITVPQEASKAVGSQWIVRRSAWQEIADKVGPEWWFSDFRTIAHLLLAGWQVLHVPVVFGTVRVYKWSYPSGLGWRWDEYLIRKGIV